MINSLSVSKTEDKVKHKEITLENCGQLARVAGGVVKLISEEGKSATLKLHSRVVSLISKNCLAIVGQVGNVVVNYKSLSRTGYNPC